MKNLLKLFIDGFTNTSIRHILMNFSMQEQCIRHPEGPVGFIARDQGQADIYAGKTRTILSVEGQHMTLATNYAVNAESISLTAKDIKAFTILGMYYNPKLHSGEAKTLLSIKDQENKILTAAFVGPETKVVDEGNRIIGKLINTVQLTSLFSLEEMFMDKPNYIPEHIEKFKLLASAMGQIK